MVHRYYYKCFSKSLNVVGRKLFLKIINHILVQLEGFGENNSIDERIRSKYCVCYGNTAWILATESRKGKSISASYIELELNETNWKHEDVSDRTKFGYSQ
jgi:hypothetical protein